MQAAIGKILPQIAAERGQRPDAVKPTKKARSSKFDKTLNLNINPTPAEGDPNWRDGNAQQQQQKFGPQPGQPQQPFTYTPEMIGKCFGTMNEVVRIMITEADALTPEQEGALGAAWYKDWNKIFGGHDRASLLLAVIATLGILGRNWANGIRKANAKKKKKGETQTVIEAGRQAAAQMEPNGPPPGDPGNPTDPQDQEGRDPVTGSRANPLRGEQTDE